jgi:hypothetical protein
MFQVTGGDSDSSGVAKAKVVLGVYETLGCGEFKPTNRLHFIFLDTLTEVVAKAEVALGKGASLFGSKPKPPDRLDVVFLDNLALPVAETEIELSVGVALSCGESVFVNRVKLVIAKRVIIIVVARCCPKLGTELAQGHTAGF